MSLLNKESIGLFKNLEEINDGFRIPDEAYVHGEDFECFESLGGDLYFSNFWYGKTEYAVPFAEQLAAYFKEKYDKIPFNEENYDFHGMVLSWNCGENTLVANINLHDDFVLYGFDGGIPPELVDIFMKSDLIKLLSDDNDNDVISLLYSDCSIQIKSELLTCVAESCKQEYLDAAIEEEINLNI